MIFRSFCYILTPSEKNSCQECCEWSGRKDEPTCGEELQRLKLDLEE